jgi:hypothetical protein
MSDLIQEKWIKGVAITTTVLAVLTAIASSRAAFCVAQNQVLTAKEGSQWAYYQAKSIKANLLESQLKVLEATFLGFSTAEQKDYLERNIKDYKANVERYNIEKEEIRTEAEKIGKENALTARKGGHFAMSVVFFQIGIMLSSVGALLKRKEMWVVGLIFGVIATLILANGVLLFY